MKRRDGSIFGAVFFVVVAVGAASPRAQTFQNYRCADGTQFLVGFFDGDKRAYLQIDGGPLTLARQPSLSGARYSGGGVTLRITKAATTVRHARRPTTACELT